MKIAKQKYEQANNFEEKQQAFASVQTVLDALTEISTITLARNNARIKLAAYRRYFTKVSRSVAVSLRTNNVIASARLFAMQAAQMSQKAPHSEQKWQQIVKM